MFKLFIAIGVIVLLGIVGAYSFLSPLFSGINSNLGHPTSPIQGGVPAPIAKSVNSVLSRISPSMWFWGLIAALTLMILFTIVSVIASSLRRARQRRDHLEELQTQARISNRRQEHMAEQKRASAAELRDSMR